MIEQLVLSHTQGMSVLYARRNTGNYSPFNFADLEMGLTVPRLGSQDLVRFAYEASKHGLQIIRFRFGDSYATRLEREEESTLSDQLLNSLSELGVGEALNLLENDLRDYTVIGVEFRDHRHNKSVLSRHGVVDGDDNKIIVKLLNELWDPLVLA